MRFHAEVADLADALRTDPTRGPSIGHAAVRSRIQARSDLPKGLLLLGLALAGGLAVLDLDRTYVVIPVIVAALGVALVGRGARAHRHARALEAALVDARVDDPAASAAARASALWTASILPGAPTTEAGPAPVVWEPPAAPEAVAGPPPNVWSA